MLHLSESCSRAGTVLEAAAVERKDNTAAIVAAVAIPVQRRTTHSELVAGAVVRHSVYAVQVSELLQST